MPRSEKVRERLKELLDQLDTLESAMQDFQETETNAESIKEVRNQYGAWYAEAKALVPSEERPRFQDMYEGGNIIRRIQSYLADPLEINQFYDPSLEDNPFIARWQIPFSPTVRDSISTQRQILVEALHAEPMGRAMECLDELSSYFSRLPEFLATLKRADNPKVPAPDIEVEKDLQHLIYALLRMLHKDVRAEDYVPQYAGASSKVDFLIKDAGVMVETKMTRPSLLDKGVGEELLVDWSRYQKHADCAAIFALVYDPGRRLANPDGLAADLSQTGTIPTRVLVVN